MAIESKVPQTAHDYHENEVNHGNYINIPLSDLVKEMLADTTDPDHYLANTPRSRIVAKLKDGVRELSKDIKRTLIDEFTISPSLYFTLPQSYVNWEWLAVIDDNGRLQPLDFNKGIHIAEAFLQDNNWEIQFANDGELLTLDANNTYAKPYNKYEFSHTYNGNQPELDTTMLSKNGEFVIDEKRGKISFSSNLSNKNIVFAYVSDGLEMENIREEDIEVRKDLRLVLKAYAYSEIIEGRQSVPANEKQRAKRKYKTLRHEAVMTAANFTISGIAKEMGSATKQP
jgi:hypothetical protein